MKTEFHVCTGMLSQLFVDGKEKNVRPKGETNTGYIGLHYEVEIQKRKTAEIIKFGGYTVSLNHDTEDLVSASKAVLKQASESGFDALLDLQKKAWEKIWEMAPKGLQVRNMEVVPIGIPKHIVSPFIWQPRIK